MPRRSSLRRRALAPTVVLALGLAAAPAASRAEESSIAYEGVVGAASALCSLIYSPIKVVYAAGGAVISALALVWTFDTGSSGAILRQTVGGDYVITPSHLEGNRDLRFFGG